MLSRGGADSSPIDVDEEEDGEALEGRGWTCKCMETRSNGSNHHQHFEDMGRVRAAMAKFVVPSQYTLAPKERYFPRSFIREWCTIVVDKNPPNGGNSGIPVYGYCHATAQCPHGKTSGKVSKQESLKIEEGRKRALSSSLCICLAYLLCTGMWTYPDV
jgi:hypothetical protein